MFNKIIVKINDNVEISGPTFGKLKPGQLFCMRGGGDAATLNDLGNDCIYIKLNNSKTGNNAISLDDYNTHVNDKERVMPLNADITITGEDAEWA